MLDVTHSSGNRIISAPAATEEKEQFSDYESISGYARDAVEKLCGIGLINGRDDNSFAPFDFATRAEAAELIYRLLGEIN